ncbi:MAG: nucleotide exchange factor GrpE [Coriobacteriia bacterium]|nr:nucleotide exchange factor GrpE [Coriobacteriia bacterium]
MTSKSDRKHAGAVLQHDSDVAGASVPAAAHEEVTVTNTPGVSVIELAAAQAEAAEWKERAARAQAEFENTRKRLAAQQEEALGRATDRVIEGLLPVVDDLDLAIAHGQEAGSDLCAGLSAIREKILAAFAREGVEVIDPQEGDPFDHDTQSAMQVVQRDDLPDQSVAQVFQKGYHRGARVIRPAMVIVSKS